MAWDILVSERMEFEMKGKGLAEVLHFVVSPIRCWEAKLLLCWSRRLIRDLSGILASWARANLGLQLCL